MGYFDLLDKILEKYGIGVTILVVILTSAIITVPISLGITNYMYNTEKEFYQDNLPESIYCKEYIEDPFFSSNWYDLKECVNCAKDCKILDLNFNHFRYSTSRFETSKCFCRGESDIRNIW